MATIETSDVNAFESDEPASRPAWFSSRYIVEVFDGADEALSALAAIQDDLVSTAFQTLDWLSCLYEELALARRGMPRLVVVSERNSREIALVLPLVIVRRRRLAIAQFADLGVSDYCAPMLGPARLVKPRAVRRAWRAIRRALSDVDLIELERMPDSINGKPNPLLLLRNVVPSMVSGFDITVSGTVQDYVASQGKKLRKESQRCERVWEREGGAAFYRATSPEDIARVYSIMEEQQAVRHAELRTRYVLNRPAYRTFYERVALDGTDAGLTYIFALESGGEIAATLFGVVHDGTFTMLRITFGGERFAHFSPGRTIILKAMDVLSRQGVTRFDFGMGDYEYKRRLGAVEKPLHDLIVSRDLRALPRALEARWRRRLRSRPWARNLRNLFSK